MIGKNPSEIKNIFELNGNTLGVRPQSLALPDQNGQ